MASQTVGTLADLLICNDKNLADRQISDLLNQAPLIRVLAADAVPGTVHKYLRETGAPSAGFRTIGTGLAHTLSTEEAVTANLAILDASFDVDKAAADSFFRGPDAYLAKEAERSLRASFFAAEKQLLYGTGEDATGFEGILDVIDSSSSMVVDAEGTTAGGCSSVFAVRSTGDLNGVVLLAGQNAQLVVSPTVTIQKLQTGETVKFYPAYYTPVEAWLGLQIGSSYSAGRITNLTASKPLTDALIAELLSKFSAGLGATHLVMSRRSQMQLQQSRTATNATGAPAPFPTESFGVPIVVTDAVVDTDNQESIGS